MSAITIQQMADRVAALMEERLKIRGQGLAEKLKRSERTLPRRVRDAAKSLAEAAHMSQNPKLLLQVNDAQVAEAYDFCLRYLSAIGAKDRRIGALQGVLGSVLFGLLAAAGLLVAVLKWRGFI